MLSNRVLILYALGSVGGALTVLAYWGLSQLAGGNLSFLSASLDIDDFYAPMVWGGVWAFLYLLPINVKMVWKGLIFSLFPAMTHLSLKKGGLTDALSFIDLNILSRHDVLVTILIYLVFWGLFTAHMGKGQSVE